MGGGWGSGHKIPWPFYVFHILAALPLPGTPYPDDDGGYDTPRLRGFLRRFSGCRRSHGRQIRVSENGHHRHSWRNHHGNLTGHSYRDKLAYLERDTGRHPGADTWRNGNPGNSSHNYRSYTNRPPDAILRFDDS